MKRYEQPTIEFKKYLLSDIVATMSLGDNDIGADAFDGFGDNDIGAGEFN